MFQQDGNFIVNSKIALLLTTVIAFGPCSISAMKNERLSSEEFSAIERIEPIDTDFGNVVLKEDPVGKGDSDLRASLDFDDVRASRSVFPQGVIERSVERTDSGVHEGPFVGGVTEHQTTADREVPMPRVLHSR